MARDQCQLAVSALCTWGPRGRRSADLAADSAVRVRLLVVIGTAPFPSLATNFVATLPRISAFLEDHTAPLIGKVYRPSPREVAKNPAAAGRVALWYPK